MNDGKEGEKERINWWEWKFEEKYVELNEKLAELKERGKAILEIQANTKRGRKNQSKTEKEEKIEEEIEKIYGEMFSSCKSAVDELIEISKEDYVSKYQVRLEELSKTWNAFKKKIEEKMKELDEEQMKPNEELTSACDKYNLVCRKIEEICLKKKEAEEEEVAFPWQLRYYLSMPPPQSEDEEKGRKVDFKGGMVTDRHGKRINEARCDLTGLLIQHWAEGEGKRRYRHMNLDIHHVVEMHELLQTLIKNIESLSYEEEKKSFKNHILSISEYAYDIFYLEDNVPAFLRMEVTDTKNCRDFIYQAFQTFKTRLALGTSKLTIYQRTKKLVTFSSEEEMLEYNDYLWLTFEQVGEYSIGLAKAFQHHLLLKERSLIGVCGMNRNEFAITDFACALSRNVMVGLHSTLDEISMSHVIKNSQLSVIVCEEDKLLMFCKLICDAKIDHVKHLILMDHDPIYRDQDISVENLVVQETSLLTSENKEYLFKKIGLKFHYIDDLSKLSQKYPPLQVELDYQKKQVQKQEEEQEGEDDNDNETTTTKEEEEEEELFTILYTSGSSGRPKGVMVSDQSFRVDCGSVILMYPLICVSFIPLSHSSDRIRIWEFLGNGGRIGFAEYAHTNWSSHETSKKLGLVVNSEKDEDGERQTNNVDQLMLNVCKIKPLAVAFPPRIWNGLYTLYHKELSKNKSLLEEEEAKKKSIEHIRTLLGNNIIVAATGGAPTSSKIMDWIKNELLSSKEEQYFMESYGTTETGAITENNKPVRGCQVKLMDLLEKGFTQTDVPHPRGEIVVKTRTMSSGYWNNPEETKRAYDDEGWFHTGDLGMMDKESGNLFILERVKAVFGLKSGRIVCPNKIESMFESCESIKQIFIHGDSSQDFLVGIIVVGDDDDEKEELLEEKIVKEMEEICLKEKSKGDLDLIPKHIIITKKHFTTENKMLNVQFKKVRSEIYSAWKPQILEMLARN